MSNQIRDNLHPSVGVIDSTKIKGYLTCPRKFFFEHILGWKPIDSAHDLIYGQALHYALEYIYGQWKIKGKPGYDGKDIINGFDIFLNHYRQSFSPDTDATVGVKNQIGRAHV